MPRSKQEEARKKIEQQRANFSDDGMLGTVLTILCGLHHLILTTTHSEISVIIILIFQMKNLRDQEVK